MIAIIDYGAGNLRSVGNAFEAIGEDVVVTKEPEEIVNAKAIVLPGVGAFGDGMENLRRLNLVELLNEQVIDQKKPYLGICLGLQFLAKESHEHGSHKGLGWVNGVVEKIAPENDSFRIPHIGWNDVHIKQSSRLFDNISSERDPVFYFVHSYSLQVDKQEEDIVTSTCWHGTDITASIQKDNIIGVQFHPEKSQRLGLNLLENFIRLIEGEDVKEETYSGSHLT